jgi:hypothetical protein
MKRTSSIRTGAAVLMVCALTAGGSAQILNAGFETAGTASSNAANWSVAQAAGGPVYAVRTNDNPHTGAFNFEVHLASVGAGPVVEFTQTGVPVIGGATYTFSFQADRLAGSTQDNDQYNVRWFGTNSALLGQTGYVSYAPGSNVYAPTTVPGLIAPATAGTASVAFHSAGGANPAWTATIDFDDVSLTTTNVISGSTNLLQATIVPGAGINWFASNNVPYQVQWTPVLETNASWTNLGGAITGNGSSNTVFDPTGPPHNFYRVISVQFQ